MLLVVVVLHAVLTLTHPADARSEGRWVFDGIDVGDGQPHVTHAPGSVTSQVTTPIVADFTGSYTPPPEEFAPGEEWTTTVRVSGVLHSDDLRGNVALEVIQLVNGVWNNVTVGSYASCQPNPFPLGPIECSPPTDGVGDFTYTLPSSGSEYTIGVGVLNTGPTITWRYLFKAASESPSSEFPEDVDAPIEPHAPVIVLPGVAGSGLGSDRGGIWPLPTAANRDDLVMDENGRPAAYVTVGSALTFPPVDFYGGMLDFLRTESGYESGVDLFTFPYDWRLSNELHFDALNRLVDEARAESGSDRVVLLAHSMGGLIARGYVLSSASRAAKVDAVITMGTPFYGAPKVYYALAEGYTFGNPTVTQSLMKSLVQNFPAAYQLLPQETFVWDDRVGRYLTLDETYDIEYEHLELDGSVRGLEQPNDALLAQASAFHAAAGTKAAPTPQPADVELLSIIGVGVKTVSAFGARSPRDDETFLFLQDEKVVLTPIFGDGDGTVPLWALDTNAATARYYVPWTADDPTAHGDLPASERVQVIVGRLLDGENLDPAEHRYNFTRADTRHDPEPGTNFSLHSDADMRITAGGRVLGVDDAGAIREELPGSFLTIRGGQYASVPNAGTYDVTITGIRTGRFTLTIDRVGDDRTDTIEFVAVPVEIGTIATTTVDDAAFRAPRPLTLRTGSDVTEIAPSIRSTGRASPEDEEDDTIAGIVTLLLIGGGVYWYVRRRRGRNSAKKDPVRQTLVP